MNANEREWGIGVPAGAALPPAGAAGCSRTVSDLLIWVFLLPRKGPQMNANDANGRDGCEQVPRFRQPALLGARAPSAIC